MSERGRGGTLSLMTALFVLPFGAALLLVSHPQWLPAARSNHGVLIAPLVPTGFRGEWTLVIPEGAVCNTECRKLQWVATVARHALAPKPRESTRLADCGGRERAACSALAKAIGGKSALVIVDPQGNALLRYGPDVAPRALLQDMQGLLNVSSYWRNDGAG